MHSSQMHTPLGLEMKRTTSSRERPQKAQCMSLG